MEELFKEFEFNESTNYDIKEINSYCKATSLYEFIKNWDKQFKGLEEV